MAKRGRKTVVPVIFHERVSKTVKGKGGVVVCTATTPVPMSEWYSEPVRIKSKSKTASEIINDTLNSHIEDMSDEEYELLDEYTKGYDSGYKSALEYSLSVLKNL